MTIEILDLRVRVCEGLILHAIREDENGSLILEFDIESVFKKTFAHSLSMKRWSAKRFEKWINELILAHVEKMEAEIQDKEEHF